MKKTAAFALFGTMVLLLEACGSRGSASAGNSAAAETPAVMEESSEAAAETEMDSSATKVINIAVGSFATSSVYSAKEVYEAENPDIEMADCKIKLNI